MWRSPRSILLNHWYWLTNIINSCIILSNIVKGPLHQWFFVLLLPHPPPLCLTSLRLCHNAHAIVTTFAAWSSPTSLTINKVHSRSWNVQQTSKFELLSPMPLELSDSSTEYAQQTPTPFYSYHKYRLVQFAAVSSLLSLVKYHDKLANQSNELYVESVSVKPSSRSSERDYSLSFLQDWHVGLLSLLDRKRYSQRTNHLTSQTKPVYLLAAENSAGCFLLSRLHGIGIKHQRWRSSN